MRGLVFSWCSIFRMAEFSSLATYMGTNGERLLRDFVIKVQIRNYFLSMGLFQKLGKRTAFGFLEGKQSKCSL